MAAEEAAAAYISDFLAVSGAAAAAAASEKLMMTKWKERKLGQRKNAKRPFFPFPFPLCWTGGGWGHVSASKENIVALEAWKRREGERVFFFAFPFHVGTFLTRLPAWFPAGNGFKNHTKNSKY